MSMQPDVSDSHVDGLLTIKPKRGKKKKMKKDDQEQDIQKFHSFPPMNMLGLTASMTLEQAPFTEDEIDFGIEPDMAMFGEVCGSCRFYIRSEDSDIGRCQILPDDVEVPWFWTSDAYISASAEASFAFNEKLKELLDPESEISMSYGNKPKRRRRKKAEEGTEVEKSYFASITKADDEKRIVTGPVLIPDVEDSQEDTVTKEQIEQAAHSFMLMSQEIQRQHNDQNTDVRVVESYIAPQDMVIGKEEVPEGTWVMSVYIPPAHEELWQAVKSGEVTGFSIRGTAKRIQLEENS